MMKRILGLALIAILVCSGLAYCETKVNGGLVGFFSRIASHLIPIKNNTYDLGSSTNQWDNLYTSSVKTNSGNLTLGGDENIQFIFNAESNKTKINSTSNSRLQFITPFYTGMYEIGDEIQGAAEYLWIQSEELNRETRIGISPSGNVTNQTNDTLLAGIKIFGTDFAVDATNNNDVGIYTTPNSIRFNTKKNGSGTLQPFIWSDMDTDYLMRLQTDGTLELYKGNIHFVNSSKNLNTYIASSDVSNGDVLILSAGTYNQSATSINVNKSIAIIGQGIGKTKFTSSTTGQNIFLISDDNVLIRDLSFTMTNTTTGTTAGIVVNGAATNVFSNVRLENIYGSVSGTGISRGIQYNDAGGVIKNVEIDITTTNAAQGISMVNFASAESATYLKIIDPIITVSGGANTTYGIYNFDSSSSSDSNLSIYNPNVQVVETSDITSYGIDSNGGDALTSIYGGFISAGNADIINENSATITTYGQSSVGNNLVSGTITSSGYAYLPSVVINTGGVANGTLCFKSDGKTIGYASDINATTGLCTCN